MDTMFVDNKTIETIKGSEVNAYEDSIADILIEHFCKVLVPEESRMLLNLSFSENPTQQDLDNFLSNWDIEVMGGHKSLMLSYFMKRHPDLKFSEYEKPRLTGLLNYFRFQNLKIIAHFKTIGKAMNEAKIPVMILKGGVMKHLRPELSRVMGDIDILVPWNDYPKAGEIAKTLGYEFYEPNIEESHSIDLHQNGSDEGTLDIHRYICMNTASEQKILKDLFARAREEKVFGVDTLVPSHEDIFFLALVNLARNLREKTSSAGLLYTLFDCKFLLEDKPNFDWNIVIENAKKTKTQIQLSFAIRFINKIVPNLLSEDVQKDISFDKEMRDYCNLVTFERFFYPEFQEKSRSIKISDSIKSLRGVTEYLKVKPKYYFLKRIKDKPALIKMLYDLIVD